MQVRTYCKLSSFIALFLAIVTMPSCITTGEVPHGPTIPTPKSNANDPRVIALAKAQAAYEKDPTNEDNIIWLGRRLAYLEHMDDAIEVYTEGLALYPDSARLLRHRGHRYISTRQFDRAIADLTRAATLVDGQPIEVEPDGAPNAAGVPRSNTQFNIYYHLGLAHYCKGELQNALAAYEKCMTVSDNDDLKCATTHWTYMTLRRLGRDDQAIALVNAFPTNPEILENDGYLALIQLYRGERDVDSMLADMNLYGLSIEDVTIGYGIVNWLRLQGRYNDARTLRTAILVSIYKYSFGYIAAETDSRFTG